MLLPAAARPLIACSANAVHTQRVTDVLRCPDLLDGLAMPAGSPELTPELSARVQRDIVRCALADRSYSPLCDMAKQLAGASARRRAA